MQGTTRWRLGLELVTSHSAILHGVTQFLLERLGFRKLNLPYFQFVQVFIPFPFPFLFPSLSLSLTLSLCVTSATILEKSLLWPCLVGGLRQCRRSRDGLFDHQAPWRSPSCPGCGCRQGERQAAKSEGEMYRQGLQVQSRVALWHFETDTRLCEESSQDNIDKVMLNLSEEFVGLK